MRLRPEGCARSQEQRLCEVRDAALTLRAHDVNGTEVGRLQKRERERERREREREREREAHATLPHMLQIENVPFRPLQPQDDRHPEKSADEWAIAVNISSSSSSK